MSSISLKHFYLVSLQKWLQSHLCVTFSPRIQLYILKFWVCLIHIKFLAMSLTPPFLLFSCFIFNIFSLYLYLYPYVIIIPNYIIYRYILLLDTSGFFVTLTQLLQVGNIQIVKLLLAFQFFSLLMTEVVMQVQAHLFSISVLHFIFL